MFETGRKYVITTIDAEIGAESQKWAVYDVDKVEGPLLRTRLGGRVIILNRQSPKFARAELLSNE